MGKGEFVAVEAIKLTMLLYAEFCVMSSKRTEGSNVWMIIHDKKSIYHRFTGATVGVAPVQSLVLQSRHARQNLALQELQRRAAAGGDVCHLLGEAQLLDRRRRVATADDGHRPRIR